MGWTIKCTDSSSDTGHWLRARLQVRRLLAARPPARLATSSPVTRQAVGSASSMRSSRTAPGCELLPPRTRPQPESRRPPTPVAGRLTLFADRITE